MTTLSKLNFGRHPVALACFLCVLAVAWLGGCERKAEETQSSTPATTAGPKKTPATKDKQPVVVCTTTMIADVAKTIGKDRIQVVGLMGPGMDPHGYEPTPDDVIWFKKADLILYNGLHLEGRMLDMIKRAGSTAVAIGEDSRIKLRGKAGVKDAPDPHCWWNAKYFVYYAERTRDALIQIDPASRAVYTQSAEAYIKRLHEADEKVRQAIKQIPEKQRVLVTSHDAFYYYGEAYGLTVDAVLGISTDAEVRALRAAELANLVVDARAPAVFHETSVSDALNQMIDRVVEIAAKKGHTVRVAKSPLFSDSLDKPTSPAGTYIGALMENTRIIVESLSGKPAAELRDIIADEG